MRIPPWLPVLLFAGYSAWAVNYWHCYKCQCCDGTPPQPPVSSGTPLFAWNASSPVADSNFVAWKKVFLAKSGQGDTLLITGLYRAGETNDGKLPNLGLARAQFLAAKMQPELPANRIKTAAKQVSDDLKSDGPPLESAEFTWLKMVLKKDEGAIIESDNAVTFLFPFNSTEKDHDPQVDAYLQKLVDKHKATTATFVIVGHTDDVGTPEENIALGLRRANAIRQFLTSKGIAAGRIQTSSKGEAEPVADNSTEDGRHQNRRVVLSTNR